MNIFLEFLRFDTHNEIIDDLEYKWLEIKENQKKRLTQALRSKNFILNLNLHSLNFLVPLSNFSDKDNIQLVAMEIGKVNTLKIQSSEEGEQHDLRLELKLLADVGIIGFPNAGKSTLISRISAAKPKIADYPFTTLTPNLGVVRYKDLRSFVVADIPGLIEGAHSGAGLGIRFLKHVERTSLLVHMVDVSGFTGRDPLKDFDVINEELGEFNAAMAGNPQIVALNKVDVAADRSAIEELKDNLAGRGYKVFIISAATGEGVSGLVDAVAELFFSGRESGDAAEYE